jgi:death-on-curing protein
VSQIKWLRLDVILAVHGKTVSEQGGLAGVRDQKLLESALARPQNLASYESEATLCDLASAYAFGIAKNHPFLDGNKRVAFYASVGFLRINGKNLKASEVDAAGTFLDLAAGAITEEELAGWFKRNC